jgi:hypothetical protein
MDSLSGSAPKGDLRAAAAEVRRARGFVQMPQYSTLLRMPAVDAEVDAEGAVAGGAARGGRDRPPVHDRRPVDAEVEDLILRRGADALAGRDGDRGGTGLDADPPRPAASAGSVPKT